LVDGWSVSNYSVVLPTKNIPTPIDQKAGVRILDVSHNWSYLEGEFDTGGITERVRLYSDRAWKMRSDEAQKHIENWRKNKRLD
jgi:hypothetical protein